MQVIDNAVTELSPRPIEDAAVVAVALMFTDLEGSTEMYERLGDSLAYRLVREHFSFLLDQVRRHHGKMVKTIGDALMAAFERPAQAVAAALAVQQNVATFNARHGGETMVIKMGLHYGPCIAVNINDRVDYFGSTVNLAARLQGECEGGDVVISQSIAADPAAARRLAPYRWREDSATLKGFGRPVRFLRYRHRDLLQPQL
jgi:class 3 adenylate cyclase